MATGNEPLGTAMLGKALDANAAQMTQLLQSLPQKAGAGSLFDAQA